MRQRLCLRPLVLALVLAVLGAAGGGSVVSARAAGAGGTGAPGPTTLGRALSGSGADIGHRID